MPGPQRRGTGTGAAGGDRTTDRRGSERGDRRGGDRAQAAEKSQYLERVVAIQSGMAGAPGNQAVVTTKAFFKVPPGFAYQF